MIINFSKIREICQTILTVFARVLYPPKCPGCDTVLLPSEYEACFCRDCRRQITFVREPVCRICGRPISDETADVCGQCKSRRAFYDMGRSLYVYNGPVKTAMYRFKYAQRKGLAEIFALQMYRSLGRWIRLTGAQAVTYVPMYRPKRRRRGYDQARELARCLAKQTGLVFVDNMVVRTKNTRPQKELGSNKRRKNLKSSFKIGRDGVKYYRVIVVDDIFTTGASIDSVSCVLKEAGVKRIFFLTVATGLSLK